MTNGIFQLFLFKSAYEQPEVEAAAPDARARRRLQLSTECTNDATRFVPIYVCSINLW